MHVDVVVSAQAVEDFDALETRARSAVLNAIDRLATWPEVSGVKALHGLDGYRIRCGSARILFEVRDGAPFVTRILARDKAYLVRKAHRQAKGELGSLIV